MRRLVNRTPLAPLEFGYRLRISSSRFQTPLIVTHCFKTFSSTRTIARTRDTHLASTQRQPPSGPLYFINLFATKLNRLYGTFNLGNVRGLLIVATEHLNVAGNIFANFPYRI